MMRRPSTWIRLMSSMALLSLVFATAVAMGDGSMNSAFTRGLRGA